MLPLLDFLWICKYLRKKWLVISYFLSKWSHWKVTLSVRLAACGTCYFLLACITVKSIEMQYGTINCNSLITNIKMQVLLHDSCSRVTHLFFANALSVALSLLLTPALRFTSILISDSICASFSFSFRISSLICLACSQQISWIKDNFNIQQPFLALSSFERFLSTNGEMTLSFCKGISAQWLLPEMNFFSISCLWKVSLTLPKSVSFCSSSRCMKGWQSCWQ